MKNTFIIFIILLIVVVGIFYFAKKSDAPSDSIACTMDAMQCPDGSYVGRTGPECQFSPCPTFNGKLVGDVYPLYQNLVWGEEKTVSKTMRDQMFTGYEVTSNELKGITDLAGQFVPFQKYYNDKLTTAGWVQNINYSADGAGSSVWMYEKGGDFIVFSYRSTAVNKSLEAPMSCPCDMVFSIFTGKSK